MPAAVYLPTARLACTFTLCCTNDDKPLFWLAIMMPAADCPTLVMVLDMLKVPAWTLLPPPAPPDPPLPTPAFAVPPVPPPAPPVPVAPAAPAAPVLVPVAPVAPAAPCAVPPVEPPFVALP